MGMQEPVEKAVRAYIPYFGIKLRAKGDKALFFDLTCLMPWIASDGDSRILGGT
jgi:hypothetical protein